MSQSLQALCDAGVSVWLDDLSRQRLRTGNLADLVRNKDVRGVTTNPSIFQQALATGDAYDDQVRELALRGCEVGEAVRALQAYDCGGAATSSVRSSTGLRASTVGCH